MTIEYVYQVYSKNKPFEVLTFESIGKVAKYCNATINSIMIAINKQQSIKGYDIYKVKISAPPRQKAERYKKRPKELLVFHPDGSVTSYPTIKACSEALGISYPTIGRHLQKGTPDKEGRTYDWPIGDEG